MTTADLKSRELKITLLQHAMDFCRKNPEVKISRKDRNKKRGTNPLILVYFRDKNLANYLDENIEDLNVEIEKRSNGALFIGGVDQRLLWNTLLVNILHEDEPKTVDGLDWLMTLFEK
jgi:hypothetical protein